MPKHEPTGTTHRRMTLTSLEPSVATRAYRTARAGLCRLALLGLIGLMPAFAYADTSVSGNISENTTWLAAQSPYVVTSDLSVVNNARLTIEAGVTVYMNAGSRFEVQAGSLSAAGTTQNPVRITSQKMQTASAAPGDWGQMIFGSGAVDSKIENAIIEYGQGIVVNSASPVFNGLNVRNNQGAAITLDLSASPTGASNVASGNTHNAVVVPAGEIAGSVTWGIKGIPYLVETGTVSVGAAPKVDSLAPGFLQQGENSTIALTGSRLSGLSSAKFETGVETDELTASVVEGGSATHASISVSATLNAPVGPATLLLTTDAGEIRLVDAITVVQQQPKLDSVAPSTIYIGQGTVDVLLAGSNLTSQSTVLVNDVAVASTYLGAGSIRATIPNQLAAGTLSIKLSTPDPINVGQVLTSNEVAVAVEQPKLTLTPATTTITSGAKRTLTLTLPYAAPEGGLVVGIASSVPAVVSVPERVIILQGEYGAVFDVQGGAAGASILTASYQSWPAAHASVSVLSESLPSLLVEYRLDEPIWSGVSGEVKDSGPYAKHGLASNGAITAPSKLCRGGHFDGNVNRYVSLPVSVQDLAVNSFTMMLWVRPGRIHELDSESSSSTAGVSGQNYALYPLLNRNKWDWDSSGYAGAGVSAGTNGISVYEHAGNYMPPVLVWAGAVSATEWTHVTVVYKNGVPSLYVNGAFKKTGVQGAHANVVPTYVIGSANYGNYSLGVDEYKLFGGELSSADIATIYANENLGMNWNGSPRVCQGE